MIWCNCVSLVSFQKKKKIQKFAFVPSPLIRNQKHLQAELRDEMLGRLDTLEKKLLRQIRKSVSVPDNRQRQVIFSIKYSTVKCTVKSS